VLLVASKQKEQRFMWSRDASRVQVLGNGQFVRIFDHEGRTWQVPARPGHLSGLLDGMYEADPECALRIVAELAAADIDHGWVEPSEPEAAEPT
jgi:hypothetical protein